MRKIRVLIAEDSKEIRDFFKMIIQNESDMMVVDVAGNGHDAVAKTIEHHPDIVLMDIQMETKTAGIEAIEKIRDFDPAIKTIVLTIHRRDDLLFKAYAVGASDYIIKTDSIVDILNSIRAVMSNNLLLRPEIANKIMGEYMRIQKQQNKMKEVLHVMMKITNTEYEILMLVYNGYSYKSIAQRRCVEETTVRSEIFRIMKKFGMNKMKDVIGLLREIHFFEVVDTDIN